MKEKTLDEQLLSYEQAADRCSLSVRYLQEAAKKGDLKVIKMGPKLHRIKPSALEAWVNKMEKQSP
jgi:excisionase family DNA binding protein